MPQQQLVCAEYITIISLILISFSATSDTLSAESQLVQMHQDFSEDPHWDGFQNRMVCRDCPTVIQDFGWSLTTHSNESPGEIGGRVDNSRIQAYYAMPLGRPLTFNDRLSASGKLAIRHIGLRGVGYIGFFNPRRHTWRVWSSLAFRIWEEDGLGQIMFDWMSSDWKARGAETAVLLADDGAIHSWRFQYDPAARVDPVWRDKQLKLLITEKTGNGAPYRLQGEPFLLERARVLDASLTAKELHDRLLRLRDQGLIEYFHRHGEHRWWKRPDPEQSHGKITFQADDDETYVFWLDEEIRQSPVELTRFGLFNIKRFGEWVELYMSDLTVNGQRIDLAQDPQWEEKNNHARWTEPNFQAMNDYGYSQTNWAGKEPGEIGGLFWRTESQDPHFSYYGDDVGELTLNDPISFSGRIRFVTGMTDAAGYFGFFNSKDQTAILTRDDSDAGFPRGNMMGLAISDSSAVGYYLVGMVSDKTRESRSYRNKVFTPNEKSHQFTFNYDPTANDGIGRFIYTLDDEKFSVDLIPEQRTSGAIFDRFGFANVRSGGHSIEFYLDDLIYTARCNPLLERRQWKQQFLEVDYPHEQAGRKF